MIKRVLYEDISIQEAYRMFVNQKIARGLSAVTIDGYNIVYSQVKKYMDIKDDDKVTIINENFIYELIERLMVDKTKGTTNHYIGTFRVFVYWLIKHNLIEPFTIELMKEQEHQLRYYTDEDLKILARKPNPDCDYTTYRSYVIVCFILATGARTSTICNIKVEDLDFDKGEVRYRHLKNKKTAVIPLSNAIVRILQEYLHTWAVSDYLFCSVTGQQLTPNALWGGLRAYCEAREVTPLGAHALRHSFARVWIINNGNAFSLQRMLCHSTLDMTKKYVRLFDDDLKKDFEQYSPLDTLCKTGKRVVHCI